MALDVAESEFPNAVLERSRELPVVVDFWAAWCGPCRTLTPALERAADKRSGKVELVKVDVDANQTLAREYGVQGIPAVKAFKDGGVVAEFVGAQPEAAVERFFDGLVPSEADALVAAGDEQSLRRALDLDPARADAAGALGRLLLARGDPGDALDVLRGAEGDFIVDGLTARAELLASQGTSPTLRGAVEALNAERHAEGLEAFGSALEGASDELREHIRHIMVGVFAELGPDHDLSREYRRKLAAALY